MTAQTEHQVGTRSRSRREAAVVLGAVLTILAASSVILPVEKASASEPVPAPGSIDLAEIDRFIEDEMKRGAIPGLALAITQDDRVLHTRGFGRDSNDKPISADTPFRIASLSKSFTALAVLQLVDAGLLDLDDAVMAHLPEFRIADPRGRDITVRQLLDHTSGLADSTSPDLTRPQPRDLVEAVAALRSVRLATDPGTTWSYHNLNYEIAARLVEVISGKSFGEYMERHLFEPAGMASSSHTGHDREPVPGLADGHVVAYGNPVKAPAMGMFEAGAGGVVSTAADMARWLIVNASGGVAEDGTRLLSEQNVRQMQTPSAPNGYALGWDTDGPAAHPTRVTHSGNLFTFSADQALLPSSGYGVALLFNSSSAFQEQQTRIFYGVLDILEGGEPPASTMLVSGATLDGVLGLLTIAALTLAARGIIRARRWATQLASAPRPYVWLRLFPYAGVLALIAAFPRIAQLAFDSPELSWVVAAYAWPALVILVLSIAFAALAVPIARATHLYRLRTGAVTAQTANSFPSASVATATGK